MVHGDKDKGDELPNRLALLLELVSVVFVSRSLLGGGIAGGFPRIGYRREKDMSVFGIQYILWS